MKVLILKPYISFNLHDEKWCYSFLLIFIPWPNGEENNIVKKIHILNDAIKLETLPIDAKYPDFRRVFPESVSNEPGNYDFAYLDDFNKAAQYISGVKNQKASLSQNGNKAALVDIDCIDCAGVIMPLNVQSKILTKPKFLFDEPKVSIKEAA